jgi:cell division protein FtsI (penicillin-binding protein 3)
MSLPPVRPERRYNAMLVGVLAVLALFGARLVYIQGLEGPRLAEEARNARLSTVALQAVRGEIVDSAGVVLATSVISYDITVNQRQIPAFEDEPEKGEEGEPSYGAAAAARLLAPILGMRVNELGARLVGDKGYVRLVRDATPETWQKVRALEINGIGAERKSERVYPNGNTAGNILGFVDWEGTGQAGLELTLQDRLAGRAGTESVEIGAAGQVIPTGARSRTDAVPGQTVHLTIDRDIQWTAQHVVDGAVDRYGAQWGAVLVQEVGTGRILALADSDAVDPNEPAASPEDSRGSRAVQNVYEPGSTGKIATVASAVEEGLVTPTTAFTVPYHSTTENGQTFKDHTEHPTQPMTTAGILADSSNTGTIQIGQLMSDATRYDYLRKFGLGEQTHLGLPGESAGIVHRPEDWDGRMRYTVMFGQGLAVNLVQNTGVLATLANGGVHVAPRLVDGYTAPGGRYEALDAPAQRQVVSAETAAEMIRMMESVIEDGTGKKAAISGYRVAGKTGTAQVADGGGGISATVASFVGVVPAEAPRIAVGVVIYKPTSGFFGGTIAAPVFHDVGSFALERLGVAPSTTPPEPYPLAPPGATAAD